jgi:hypothetical protein
MKKCDTCWGTGEDLDHESIGRDARRHRLSRARTLRVQATRLGISESFLCLLELGKRKWTEDLYRKATA